MSTPTTPLNKTQLAAAVAAQLGVSLDDGFRTLDAVLDTITRTVTTGRDVTITNFGTFRAVTHAARTARNPQTGAPVPVPQRAVVHFRVAPRLQQVVRAGDPTASIRKRSSR
jgi:DNA-binding protein HU-beta